MGIKNKIKWNFLELILTVLTSNHCNKLKSVSETKLRKYSILMTYKCWSLSKLLLIVMVTTTCYSYYPLCIGLITLSDLFPSHSYTMADYHTHLTGNDT